MPPAQALEYLFKFIVQSRILYSRATCGMEEEQFRANIQELFQSIRFVLSLDSRSSETLVFTQVRWFLGERLSVDGLVCQKAFSACLAILFYFCLFLSLLSLFCIWFAG